MGKKSRTKRERRETKVLQPDSMQQRRKILPKIFSRKHVTAVSVEIILLVGGEMLGHISPYLKIGAWLIACILLVYYLVPFKALVKRFLRHSHLITKKKTMAIISKSHLLVLVIVSIFVFQPLVGYISQPQTTDNSESQNTPAVITPSSRIPTFIDASEIDPSQEVEIHVGSFTFDYRWSDFTGGKKLQPMKMNELYPFNVHTFGNRLYVDVSVYGSKDLKIINIENNVATVIPEYWDKNHDDYAYEVVNETEDPIFQLIYETQFSISIYGIFPMPGGMVLYASKTGNTWGNSPFVFLHLDPIFKYPSVQYPEQRVIPLVSDMEDSQSE